MRMLAAYFSVAFILQRQNGAVGVLALGTSYSRRVTCPASERAQDYSIGGQHCCG